MDEEHSSKRSNLPEMFRNSQHARKIIQTTQPIFEEFSTSVRTIGFSNENEVTYATSFFSQVGFSEYNRWSIYRQDLSVEIVGKVKSDSQELSEKSC